MASPHRAKIRAAETVAALRDNNRERALRRRHLVVRRESTMLTHGA